MLDPDSDKVLVRYSVVFQEQTDFNKLERGDPESPDDPVDLETGQSTEAVAGDGKDPVTPGGSFRGRTNSKPLHRVKDLPHSRRMPWETQPARMRAVVAPRRVNHTTTPPSRQKELHAVGAQTYES